VTAAVAAGSYRQQAAHLQLSWISLACLRSALATTEAFNGYAMQADDTAH